MRRRSARALVLLVLLAAPGCMRWSATPMPAPGGSTEPIEKARITLDPAGTVLLRDVVVRSDSVIGHREGGQRVALHRSHVRGIEAREVSAWRTAGAVVGAAAVTYVALVIYSISTMDWWAGAVVTSSSADSRAPREAPIPCPGRT